MKSVVRLALPLTFALTLSFSLLFAAGQLFVLLDSAVSLFHFAVAVVRRAAAATVGVLTVHARLAKVSRGPDLGARVVRWGKWAWDMQKLYEDNAEPSASRL